MYIFISFNMRGTYYRQDSVLVAAVGAQVSEDVASLVQVP